MPIVRNCGECGQPFESSEADYLTDGPKICPRCRAVEGEGLQVHGILESFKTERDTDSYNLILGIWNELVKFRHEAREWSGAGPDTIASWIMVHGGSTALAARAAELEAPGPARVPYRLWCEACQRWVEFVSGDPGPTCTKCGQQIEYPQPCEYPSQHLGTVSFEGQPVQEASPQELSFRISGEQLAEFSEILTSMDKHIEQMESQVDDLARVRLNLVQMEGTVPQPVRRQVDDTEPEGFLNSTEGAVAACVHPGCLLADGHAGPHHSARPQVECHTDSHEFQRVSGGWQCTRCGLTRTTDPEQGKEAD